MVAGARDRAAAAAVIHEGVDRLLEHALLVPDDDLRRTQLEQTLEPVVPVDHASVEVVQLARRESAAVELHHRAKVRRDDREDREDHPLGRRARAKKRLHQTEPLDGLLAALAHGRAHLGLELERELLEVDLPHDLEHGLGAHLRAEEAVLVGERAVLGLGLRLERLDAHDLFALGLRLVADDLHVGCDVLTDDGEVLVGAHADVGDLLFRIRAGLLLFLRPVFTIASSCFCRLRCSCVSIDFVTLSPFSAIVSSACLKTMSLDAGLPTLSSSCSFTFDAAVVRASESEASCSSCWRTRCSVEVRMRMISADARLSTAPVRSEIVCSSRRIFPAASSSICCRTRSRWCSSMCVIR